jgi:hypothetical protein
MGAIVIESDDSLMKIFKALAKKTGARTFDISNETLEDLEDVRLYDEAKKNDNGERVLFSDYLAKRKNKNV